MRKGVKRNREEEKQRKQQKDHRKKTPKETRKQSKNRQKTYRQDQRSEYYANTTQPNSSSEARSSSVRFGEPAVLFEEENLNCPSASKYPKNCTSRSDYLRQAKIFHPDRNPGCTGTATKKFQVLQRIRKNKNNKGGKRGSKRKTNKKRIQKNKSRKSKK